MQKKYKIIYKYIITKYYIFLYFRMSKLKYIDDDNDVDFLDEDIEEDAEIIEKTVEKEEDESEDDFDEENRLKMKEAYEKYINRLNEEKLNEEMKTINIDTIKKKENKKKTVPNKISLDKFILDQKNIENANKPKKFVSKRVEDKMKTKNIIVNTYKKREFNPRKPPFNLVIILQSNNLQNSILDNTDFPSL